MNRTIFIFIISFLIISYSLHAQTPLKSNNEFTNKKIIQEKVFIHQNTSFLLSGEVLYYRVYCLDMNTRSLSKISKIAYVELISNNNSRVFKHKIKLKSGLGQGDFLIPNTIPSGNYKLISYTQSMRNFGTDIFFQGDLSIINPYLENQSNIFNKNKLNSVQNIKHIPEIHQSISGPINSISNSYISLSVNAKSYKKREKVILTINSLNKKTSYGNYSISIRKIDTIPIAKLLASKSIFDFPFSNKFSHNIIKKIKFLPELRGELITGVVKSKNNKKSCSNIKIGLSISGKQPIFKISTTNNLGVFYFNLHEDYKNSDAIIQVIDNDSKQFTLSLNKNTSINYENLNFYNFKLYPKLKDYILKRYIYNQIENVYKSFKSDSFKNITKYNSFFDSKAKIYNLDDYTRFPTIKETVVEIINEIYIKQRKGVSTFHVKLYNEIFESKLLPLVLVDGILIQNHDKLLDINVENIKKISVVSENYLYDSQLYEGIISIQTFKGNYQIEIPRNYCKKVILFKPLAIKKYFNQVYDDSSASIRIPDYRSQLLWKPNFILNTEHTSLSFFTSDNIGNYEICLEGFTKNGVPVSIRKVIIVQ